MYEIAEQMIAAHSSHEDGFIFKAEALVMMAQAV